MVASAPQPPPPAPAKAHVSLALHHVHGRGGRRFAIVGERVRLTGEVSPYVAGQHVIVRIRRADGGLTKRAVRLVRASDGGGTFALKVPTGTVGTVRIEVSHQATAAMDGFSHRPLRIKMLSPNLSQGARGPAVWLLQRSLASLHYAVPLSGVFESGTGNALLAYRKVVGMNRVATSDAAVFRGLLRRRGSFHVRYPHDGRHVEADLSKQVLAEIAPGGKVFRVYTISSGKPSTPTVLGRFRVYLKTPGTNSEGMVYSNYFIRGYAIHGYAEVPTYPASHGCLRLPIEDAIPVYSWVRVGTPVDVYE